MDNESMDHYEKQLYTVFKTFDVANEEALDKSAVLDLCDALQLDDRGTALVDTLFERPVERVTFSQFRNGLLSVLGAGEPPAAPGSAAAAPALHSDEDSSGREVAPKFVFGSKKYGRRSRPHSATAAVSRVDNTPPSPADRNSDNNKQKSQMKCKRATPVMEGNSKTKSCMSESSDLDHDRLINYEQSMALCHSLNMDRIDPQLIRQIFQEATTKEITVGDFFDRLNSSLTMSIATSCDTNGSVVNSADESGVEDAWGPGSMLMAEAVIDAWEHAGIEHSRRLLLELGFTSSVIRASDLSRALDDEIRAFTSADHVTPDAHTLLLQAALVLQRLRLAHANQLTESATAENVKLRTDLADANRRAQTLAQEVDENHARIESSLKVKIKQLESKHLDEMKAATTEWTAERDKMSQTIVQLEETVARLTNEETKLESEMTLLKEQNHVLSRRVSNAEERVNELEVAKSALAANLKSVEENLTKNEGVTEDSYRIELTNQIEELRLQNKMLRDRNDELCGELEASVRGGGGGAAGAGGDAAAALLDAASWRDETALGRRLSQIGADDCDQSYVSLDQKVIGHIEVIRRLQTVLENVTQVSVNKDNGCESCGTLMGIITTIQEKVQELSDSVILADQSGLKLDVSMDAAAQTEADDELANVKKILDDTKVNMREENERLSNIIKELECSLEQMKLEYEKCEDYWSNKLQDEREIYNEEQKLSDDRLNELINKISEYEQQFAPKSDNKLPTIDEKDCLELQFTELEEEFQSYKDEKEKELAAMNNELESLKEKLKSHESTLTNGHDRRSGSPSSPIEYLWSQGTIHRPYNKGGEQRRDYQNPAFGAGGEGGEVRSASDGEREGSVAPIQRPGLGTRSCSAGALPAEPDPAPDTAPHMIHCAELEGQLRQQAQRGVGGAACACAELAARCRALTAALAHRQLMFDTAQQSAYMESRQLRARMTAAEGAVSRLTARLASADLLVKDLYLENCQLAHQQTRLL